MTSEGYIPNLIYGGAELPVMLEINMNLISVREIMRYQRPKKLEGRLCYALPNGGMVTDWDQP